MTDKQLLRLINERLAGRLADYESAADSQYSELNNDYNIGRIQATKAILWELEDVADLYDLGE